MSIGKTVGGIADKMLKLTGKAVKKLEDYGEKSAVENNNENARKLAATMKKLGSKLEAGHETYIHNVEKNADELAQQGKEAFDKLKLVCKEMKIRAGAAKEKAEKDVANDKRKNEEDGDKENSGELGSAEKNSGKECR